MDSCFQSLGHEGLVYLLAWPRRPPPAQQARFGDLATRDRPRDPPTWARSAVRWASPKYRYWRETLPLPAEAKHFRSVQHHRVTLVPPPGSRRRHRLPQTTGPMLDRDTHKIGLPWLRADSQQTSHRQPPTHRLAMWHSRIREAVQGVAPQSLRQTRSRQSQREIPIRRQSWCRWPPQGPLRTMLPWPTRRIARGSLSRPSSS